MWKYIRKIILPIATCVALLLGGCSKEGVCDYCWSEGKVKKFYVSEDASSPYELCEKCYNKAEKGEIDMGRNDISPDDR